MSRIMFPHIDADLDGRIEGYINSSQKLFLGTELRFRVWIAAAGRIEMEFLGETNSTIGREESIEAASRILGQVTGEFFSRLASDFAAGFLLSIQSETTLDCILGKSGFQKYEYCNL